METTELEKALAEVKRICKMYPNCFGCPYSTEPYNICRLNGFPEDWLVNVEGVEE